MTYSKTVLFLFSIIAFSTLNLVLNPPIVANTVLYILSYVCIFIFIILGIIDKEFKNIPTHSKRIIIIYWLYSIFITIYGFILAETYWDYKNIFTGYVPGVFMSFIIFIGLGFEKNLSLLRFIIKIIFPIAFILGVISFLFFSITNPVAESTIRYDLASSRLAVPIFFLILAMPFLKKNHQFLIIFISIFCIIVDLKWRTNILRIITCWSFVLIYFLFSLKKRLLNFIGIIIFVTPLIFLYYGASGKFDVFEYIFSKNYKINIDLKKYKFVNTRTFLYEEVFDSISKKNTSLLIGGSAAAGYQTFYFSDEKISKYSGHSERYRSEARFLNTLNQSGIIGVIIDMLLLFIPGYIAINRSNNSFSKLLGLYLFFSWPLYFIEMPLALNLNYFLYYFIIGLCLSNSLRKSNDKQIKSFFKSI